MWLILPYTASIQQLSSLFLSWSNVKILTHAASQAEKQALNRTQGSNPCETRQASQFFALLHFPSLYIFFSTFPLIFSLWKHMLKLASFIHILRWVNRYENHGGPTSKIKLWAPSLLYYISFLFFFYRKQKFTNRDEKAQRKKRDPSKRYKNMEEGKEATLKESDPIKNN